MDAILSSSVDYLSAVLVSSTAVMALSDLRKGQGDCEKSLVLLKELRKYVDGENGRVFLDYIVAAGLKQDYSEVRRKIIENLIEAQYEIERRKPGKAIESIMGFADNFGDVCLAMERLAA